LLFINALCNRSELLTKKNEASNSRGVVGTRGKKIPITAITTQIIPAAICKIFFDLLTGKAEIIKK